MIWKLKATSGEESQVKQFAWETVQTEDRKINEKKTGHGVSGAATGIRTMEQKKRTVTQERDELCGDLKARH